MGKRKRSISSNGSSPARQKKKDKLIDDPVAVEILKSLAVSPRVFSSGKVLAWSLSPEDEAFIDIHDYIERSQEHQYGIKILSILRVATKVGEIVEFQDDPQYQNLHREMLWHGTKPWFVAPILESGLQVPANTFQMFGRGIYFADRISKSANYCGSPCLQGGTFLPSNGQDDDDDIGYLFLCDVLLGKIKACTAAMNHLTSPPAGFDSLKGTGKFIPDPEWNKVANGCTWPLGPTIRNTTAPITASTGPGGQLLFNEYVVYDPKHVQPKYLVKVQFKKEKHHENN